MKVLKSIRSLLGVGALIFCFNIYAQPVGSLAREPRYIAALVGLPPLDTIIENNLDVNMLGVQGTTPIMLAAMLDDDKSLVELLHRGAKIDARDERGNSAASHALDWMSFRSFNKLVEFKVLDRIKSDDAAFMRAFVKSAEFNNQIVGNMELEAFVRRINAAAHQQMLIYASKGGGLNLVSFLLELGASIRPQPSDGKSAIHAAAQSKNVDVVKLLIERGANVNAPDQSGLTPLHYAVGQSNDLIIQLLIDSGAETQAETKNGITPAGVAIFGGNDYSLGVILRNIPAVSKYINDNFLIDDAIGHKNSVALIHTLLRFGADPDIRRRGEALGTHLHTAISLGEADIAKLLIDAGADMHRKNPISQKTAVEMIRESKHSSIRLLIN